MGANTYSIESYKQPFWADNKGFKTGRDPLGIQNSSVTVYSKLLPGMTNLTLRLRYYGFFCWVLDEYRKIDPKDKIKDLSHHYNLIRSAELAIAFITLSEDSTQNSIVGSDYVFDHLSDIDNQGYYDIEKGAVQIPKEDTKTYWKFKSGALGQYYVGSLVSLNLIEVKDKFYVIQESGKKLASAFRNSFKDTSILEEFIKFLTLSQGKLTKNDLSRFKPLSIHKISFQSEEWHFYKQMLLGDDFNMTKETGTTYKRKETLHLFLDHCLKEKELFVFDRSQFEIFIEKNSTMSSNFGWYYYYLNETIHYSVETLFYAMLHELDGKSLPINDFINDIAQHFLKSVNLNNSCPETMTVENYILSYTTDIIKQRELLEQLVKSPSKLNKATGVAIDLLFASFMEYDQQKEQIMKFETQNGVWNQKGRISETMQLFVQRHQHKQIHEYFLSIIKLIINDHITTAYRKMGNGEANLLKFVIEDGFISHVQTMQPKFTNPRIKTLNNFLVDLKLITEKQKCTQEGLNVLTEIES